MNNDFYFSSFTIDFRNLNESTVWRHLNTTLFYNYDVLAKYQKGFKPYLPDNKFYIFIHNQEIVVVCLDACGNGEEQTYYESEVIDSMVYRPGREPRESMLWKFNASLGLMRKRLHANEMDVTVYGLLLTEANILNAEELNEVWESLNIKVICGLKNVGKKKIRMNSSNGRNHEDLVNVILDIKTDELEKLMKAYIEKNSVDTEEQDDKLPDNDDDLDWPEDDDDIKEDGDEEMSDTTDELPHEDHAPQEEYFPTDTIEQNDFMSVKVEILRPLANPRGELDKLIGCADIKRRMDELVALTRYNKMMREMFPDSKQHEVSLHSVFLGRPGTGKTTVAKIFGSLLRQAGALSKGHVVVCDRSTFIGKYFGDEERVVRQVLDKARGGVLMIDEAYLFNQEDSRDPGKIAIQQLLGLLADESQRDIAVLLCGYKEPMQKLLDMNPGLQSRFPNKFEFNDFSVNELLEITKCRIKEYNYQFTNEAWEKYGQLLEQAYQNRDPQTWGNARFVANQLDQIYIRHAMRCVQEHFTDKSQLLTITPEDIVPFEAPRPKVKIGFC